MKKQCNFSGKTIRNDIRNKYRNNNTNKASNESISEALNSDEAVIMDIIKTSS